MLINSQNLFFKSNSQLAKKNKSELLAVQVTKTDNSDANPDFKKSRLSAIWHEENGKIVCKWVIN